LILLLQETSDPQAGESKVKRSIKTHDLRRPGGAV